MYVCMYVYMYVCMFDSTGEPVVAEGYLEKALSPSQDIGHLEKEFACLCALTSVTKTQK